MQAFSAQVIDKQTVSEFVLRVSASSQAACISRLFELGFVVGRVEQAPELLIDPEYRADALRQSEMKSSLQGLLGREYPIDPQGKVWAACFSGDGRDISVLIEALKWESELLDRHFLLQRIVRTAYTVGNPKGASKVKSQSKTSPEVAWPLVERFGWQWIVEADTLRPSLKADPQSSDESANYLGITVLDDLRKHLKARGFKNRAKEIESMEEAFFSS